MVTHSTGFSPISSTCKADSDSGEVCSGSPCEISRLKSVGLSFPVNDLVFTMVHFQEDDGIAAELRASFTIS